ncbi:hypothetical protein DFH06DRAFT_1378357 [Mycena polygramma]|nr:hypothetical protein DFH06DRAFT_1351716 [Mycena polygramma]KAJ7668597.1 hypothetical protein DFH06DRAFT_1378357 [Mycena polygramma]
MDCVCRGEEWMKITFRPDLKRFGMDRITEGTARCTSPPPQTRPPRRAVPPLRNPTAFTRGSPIGFTVTVFDGRKPDIRRPNERYAGVTGFQVRYPHLFAVSPLTIVENILNINCAQFEADQQIKKTDGTKRSRLTSLPEVADADNAGTMVNGRSYVQVQRVEEKLTSLKSLVISVNMPRTTTAKSL